MQSDNLKLIALAVGCGVLTVLVIVAAQSGSFYTPADGVVQLTTENFASEVLADDAIWVVQFYAVWCAKCHGIKAEYKLLAKALKGVIKVGIVNAEEHTELSKSYKIRGYPMIKIFGVDKQQPTDYFGLRTAKDIGAAAITEISRKLNLATNEAQPEPAAVSNASEEESNLEQEQLDVEVMQLTGEPSLQQACQDKLWCLIAVLPPLTAECDVKCRRSQLAVLRATGGGFRTQPWGWLWGEGGQQPLLERRLAISRVTYPTVVAFNCSKLKYVIYKGNFDRAGLAEFFKDISNGRDKSAYIFCDDRPMLNSVPKWHDQDAKKKHEERPIADEL